MLVAVGGDKGAPGATTLAVLLGLLWPREAVVADLDLRGATLPFRMSLPDGRPLARTPSVATLAVDVRPGVAPPSLERYAQLTAVGVPVIPGVVPVPNEVSAAGESLGVRARANLARHLPAIADAAQTWSGMVIADIGAVHPGRPASPLVRASALTLLVTRPSAEGLARLWEHAAELSAAVGDPSSLGVVLVAPAGEQRVGEERARAVLDLVGCPAHVVGSLVWDERGADQLWRAAWPHRLSRWALYRSAQGLLERMFALWPQVLAPVPGTSSRAPTIPNSMSQNEGVR
jgi:hypothetical protein